MTSLLPAKSTKLLPLPPTQSSVEEFVSHNNNIMMEVFLKYCEEVKTKKKELERLESKINKNPFLQAGG